MVILLIAALSLRDRFNLHFIRGIYPKTKNAATNRLVAVKLGRYVLLRVLCNQAFLVLRPTKIPPKPSSKRISEDDSGTAVGSLMVKLSMMKKSLPSVPSIEVPPQARRLSEFMPMKLKSNH